MENKNRKKIFYQNLGIHTYMQTLMDNPPEGYEFIINHMTKRSNFINRLKKSKFISSFYSRFKKTVNVLPILEKIYNKKTPKGVDLILTTNVVIEEDKPWIMLILDTPYSMAGNDYDVFHKNIKKFEKYLASDNCKMILIHAYSIKKIMEKYFSKKVLDKTIVFNPGINANPDSSYVKKPNKNVNFLFMGSINNPDEFYIKGGLETLETFILLNKKYPETRLVMRCKLPQEVIEKYDGKLKNVKIISNFISKEELEELYKNSDVLLMPGYCYFVMVYLEAFSYALPIIALDTFGVSEFINQGKNGFYVPASKNFDLSEPKYPINIRTKEFIDKIKNVDQRVINDLYKKSEMLIKNKSMRTNFSKNAFETFQKRFTLKNQNKELKRILDKIKYVKG